MVRHLAKENDMTTETKQKILPASANSVAIIEKAIDEARKTTELAEQCSRQIFDVCRPPQQKAFDLLDEVIKINDDGQPTRNSRSSHSYIRVKDGETVVLGGTLRSVSEDSRKAAKEGIQRVANNIAKAHGAWAEVNLIEGYDVTVNDARMVNLAAKTSREMLGDHSFFTMPAPVMGAEDWSYVLQKIPGCMVFLGVAPAGCDHNTAAPCHSNKMQLEESAMAHGVALYAAVAERFLDRGFD